MHPGRAVALPVQHPPDIDVIVALDVEHQMRVARQRPEPQARKVQLVGVTGRAGGRAASDVDVGLLQCIDDTRRSLRRAFAQVVRDGLINIPP